MSEVYAVSSTREAVIHLLGTCVIWLGQIFESLGVVLLYLCVPRHNDVTKGSVLSSGLLTCPCKNE